MCSLAHVLGWETGWANQRPPSFVLASLAPRYLQQTREQKSVNYRTGCLMSGVNRINNFRTNHFGTYVDTNARSSRFPRRR
jgi:hypothetical protein